MGLSVQEISDRYGPQAAQDAYTSDVLFGTDNKAISEQTFKFKYVVTIAVETMPIEADPGNLILKISLIAFKGLTAATEDKVFYRGNENKYFFAKYTSFIIDSIIGTFFKPERG